MPLIGPNPRNDRRQALLLCRQVFLHRRRKLRVGLRSGDIRKLVIGLANAAIDALALHHHLEIGGSSG
jgi:hypothetical protein